MNKLIDPEYTSIKELDREKRRITAFNELN